jgi:hypothetical protein
MALLNCLGSYSQDVSGCIEELIISNSSLTEGADYVVKMTYPSGWVVKRDLTANEYSGDLIIPNQNFWHVGTGPVVVEVYSASDNNCTPINFTVCDKTYSSITVNFINITQDDNSYANIPCDCAE